MCGSHGHVVWELWECSGLPSARVVMGLISQHDRTENKQLALTSRSVQPKLGKVLRKSPGEMKATNMI